MKEKNFDCIGMKRKGTERVMKRLDGKSFQEQLEYWKKSTEDLKKLQKKLRETSRLP